MVYHVNSWIVEEGKEPICVIEDLADPTNPVEMKCNAAAVLANSHQETDQELKNAALQARANYEAQVGEPFPAKDAFATEFCKRSTGDVGAAKEKPECAVIPAAPASKPV